MAMKYYTEIVPFELAKKLKEAGYKEECSGHYAKDGLLWETHPKQNSNDTEIFFSAPMYCEVFDWLIGKGLSVEMTLFTSFCGADLWRFRPMFHQSFEEKNFYEAANAAIEKACEILQGDV